MGSQLLIGILIISLTVVIHAIALDRLMVLLGKVEPAVSRVFKRAWKAPMLVVAVMGCFLAHILEIWVWAIFYIQVGALTGFEESLYFSTTTFTTVGYGDIYLDVDWRLLSSFQSANGFMLFGWSTAFIFEVMAKLYKNGSFQKA